MFDSSQSLIIKPRDELEFICELRGNKKVILTVGYVDIIAKEVGVYCNNEVGDGCFGQDIIDFEDLGKNVVKVTEKFGDKILRETNRIRKIEKEE